MNNFTDKEFGERLNQVYKKMTRELTPSNVPKAFVLGGQPGAGKSSLISRFKKEMMDNAVVINGDDFRQIHPNFKNLYKAYGDEYVQHTAAFSGKMTEALIEKCSSEGYNLVIEGTLRNPNTPLNTAKLLKEKGYEVNLAVMAVPPAMSYLGTLTRYEEMQKIGTIPRATTKEQHDNTAKLMVENVGKVYEAREFDNIQLYNREGKCLYDQKETPEINPKKVMYHAHNRLLTMAEITQCQKELPVILDGMKSRNDPRLSEVINFSEEIKHVEMQVKNDMTKNAHTAMNSLQNIINSPNKSMGHMDIENR